MTLSVHVVCRGYVLKFLSAYIEGDKVDRFRNLKFQVSVFVFFLLSFRELIQPKWPCVDLIISCFSAAAVVVVPSRVVSGLGLLTRITAL